MKGKRILLVLKLLNDLKLDPKSKSWILIFLFGILCFGLTHLWDVLKENRILLVLNLNSAKKTQENPN